MGGLGGSSGHADAGLSVLQLPRAYRLRHGQGLRGRAAQMRARLAGLGDDYGTDCGSADDRVRDGGPGGVPEGRVTRKITPGWIT